MKLDGLIPEVRAKADRLLAKAEAVGIHLAVTSALRTFEEQEKLYAQGRTTPGNVVTNARAGESWHNFGRAFDVAFRLQGGSVSWDGPWEMIGQMGEECGLEWGGRWERLKDKPHFQDRGGMTLRQAMAKHQSGVQSPKEAKDETP